MPERSLSPLLSGLLLLAGCYPDTPILVKSQRLPRPMENVVDPLPPGTLDLYPPGPEEVTVVRHADPVQIRPAGLSSSFPMPFYRKQARVNSGTWVFCGAGGRTEIFWPNGTAILLDGHGRGVIGSASRGEPTFLFFELDRARIMLMPGDRVELLGGSVLIVDQPVTSPIPAAEEGAEEQAIGPARIGPVVVEHISPEIVRMVNRCKDSVTVLFREDSLRVEPGESLDMPLLEVGARPFAGDPGFQTLPGDVEVRGEVEIVGGPQGESLRAIGDHELKALGVRVRLDQGEEASFLGLDGRSMLESSGSSESSGGSGDESVDGGER